MMYLSDKRKLQINLTIFVIVLFIFTFIAFRQVHAITVSRSFDWATSTQDWVETGTGNHSILLGGPPGSFINRLSFCPVKCESKIRWKGSWSDLFQVYEPFYVSEILSSLGTVDYNYVPSAGDKRHSFEVWDKNEHVKLADIVIDHLHCNDEGEDCRTGEAFIGEAEGCDPQTCIAGRIITYQNLVGHGDWDDEITLVIENSIENYIGILPATLLADNPIIKADIASTTFSTSWLIPTAYANTECEFISAGPTTTAECSDLILRNETQDIYNGLILFFVMFFGLIFYFSKRGGD